MGRPPLHVKPTIVRLTEDVIGRIEALVGPNKRSAFIREAIEAELERREQLLASGPIGATTSKVEEGG